MTSKWSGRFFADLAERIGSTFLAAFIPLYVAGGSIDALDWPDALMLAASAAGLSLLKGLAANLASPESGASLLSAASGPVIPPDDPDGGF